MAESPPYGMDIPEPDLTKNANLLPRSTPDVMDKSGYESSSSSSDTSSFTEDLDQIGRFSMSNWSSYLTNNNLPKLPNLSNLPNLPNLSNLTSFDLNDVSKYVSLYVNSIGSNGGGQEKDPMADETSTDNVTMMNSLKTALATKIQMTSFLSDLKEGLSLQAAIDRLQPLTDVIHEAITLPADDEEEESDDEYEQVFEPVGVGKIVNREQPLITELVLPDEQGRSQEPSKAYLLKKLLGTKNFRRAGSSVLSDSYDSGFQTGSDLDHFDDDITPAEITALTHLDSLDDFYEEDMLRKRIQKIQSLSHLSQASRNKLVTRLMMGNYYKYINQKLMTEKGISLKKEEGLHLPEDRERHESTAKDAGHDDEEEKHGHGVSHSLDENLEDAMEDTMEEEVDEDEVVLTEKDQMPSYHDKEKGIMGCPHYRRNCKLECPTCLKWFPCRFCHDQEVTDHKMQRNAVRHVLCMRCNAPQVPETNYCVNCEGELANYFCLKCVLYDDDPNKDIYHCDKCGICRLGLGLSKDYFHCDECNICLSIDLKEHHKCVSNTTHCNCPICNEYLFTSVNKVAFMKCGHLIHQGCYDEMIKHSYKCPICKKTVVNVDTQFRILDQEIRRLPLPAPYNMWRCIISCNDCKGKSNCAYHVLGLKCKYCKSYNTNQLKLVKPEEEDDEREAEAEVQGEPIRLIQTNLSSNFIIGEQLTDNNTEYDGGYSTDELDPETEANAGNIINIKRLTKSLLGSRDNERGPSITSVFQKFINNTVSGGYDNNEEEELLTQKSHDEEEEESDMELVGGF